MSGLQLPGDIGSSGSFPEPDFWFIDRQVSWYYKIDSVRDSSQNKAHREARRDFIVMSYLYGYTQEQIAEYIGYKDHSTVSHHLKKGLRNPRPILYNKKKEL